MDAFHLHFGPGSLGLGLIVHSANEVKLDSHLVGRTGSPAAARNYMLELTGREPAPLRVSSYSEGDCFGDLTEATQAAVTSRAPMLITTAVGPGLGGCAEMIVEIASHRACGGGHTVFIACENSVDDSYHRLVGELKEFGVDCRATMVNRICPSRELVDDKTRLAVRADPHGEWLIEGEVEGEALRRIGQAKVVNFVADVEPFARRKLWLVNGAHLALALFAREKKETSIRVIAREPERQEQLIEIHADMAQALPDQWQETLGDTVAYGHEQLIPFCRTEDSTNRILRKLRRADLTPFFEDLDRKLGEPARSFAKKVGKQSFGFEDLFELLQEILLDLDHYEDSVPIRNRKIQLDPTRDEEAVASYDTLLTGVISKATRKGRVEALRRRLARHRLAAT